MGKTRDLFKKIGDIKGTFHAKRGTTLDRNHNNQTKAKKRLRGGKKTQKNYTKEVLITHQGTIYNTKQHTNS